MADCWVDIQFSVIAKITHSSFRSYRLRLQRGFNFWLLGQLLSPEDLYEMPPPVFVSNDYQAPPKVLSVGIVSDLREVSIDDCWDSYYWLTDQILPDLPPPDFARNCHQAKPTVFSVGIGSYVTKVSVSDFWYSYYWTNPPSILHPLFSRGIIIRHNPQFCPLV